MPEKLKETRHKRFLLLLKGYKRDADLAEALGIAASYVSNIKHGRKGIGDEARAWERVLNLPRHWFDEEGDEFASEPPVLVQDVRITRAGLMLGAMWELLDIEDRVEYERRIRAALAAKQAPPTTSRAKKPVRR